MKKILSIALLALLTMGVANAQTADAIAKKYVDAIGGAAKWSSIKNSKMTISINQQGVDIPGFIVGDVSNRLRLELAFSGMKMIQATDGTTPWGMNQFAGQSAPAKMTGAEAKGMSEEEFLDKFIDYKKRGYSLALDGEATIEGKACHKLKLTKEGHDDTTHYFDKESGLRIAEESVVAGQTIVEVYGDYTEVQGVMAPMKVTQKSGGATQLVITISKIEYNVELTDDMFTFPGN